METYTFITNLPFIENQHSDTRCIKPTPQCPILYLFFSECRVIN